MKTIKKIFHFLGGLYFAIFLIASTAFLVSLGTILESKTNSHQYAAQYTYEHPLFLVLLSFYFINILFSALRRWPFQKRHIPFLITHFGLLMILSGVILKNLYGIQGSLNLIEGTANHLVTIPNSYCLKVEKINPENPLNNHTYYYDLNGKKLSSKNPCEDIKITFRGLHHNVEQYYRSWIFEKEAMIQGLKPFPFFSVNDLGDIVILNPSTKVSFDKSSAPWNVYAFKSDLEEEILQKLIVENGSLEVSLIKDYSKVIPLKELIAGIKLDSFFLKGDLNLDLGGDNILLAIKMYSDNNLCYSLTKHLTGSKFIVENQDIISLIHKPFKMVLKVKPCLALLQNSNFETSIWSIDEQGFMTKQHFPSQNLNSLVAYGEGFGGYTQRYSLTMLTENLDDVKERILLNQLEEAPIEPNKLPPPLKRFYDAVKYRSDLSFGRMLFAYLKQWEEQKELFFKPDSPLMEVIEQIHFSKEEKKTLSWIVQTFQTMTDSAQLSQSPSLRAFLKSQKQNLFQELAENETDAELLTHFGQQIFNSPNLLDDIPICSKHQLLGAYFLIYGISYQSLKSILTENDFSHVSKVSIDLESPLRMVFKNSTIAKRPEDQTTLIALDIVENEKKYSLALPYNKTAFGISWPTASRQYLLRFEPQQIELPYRVRLHRAWQDNYLNSAQALSYESKITLEKKDQAPLAAHLKMNYVHETNEGYRFYLANVSDSETMAKRVHLIVNYDPVKYWFTYPGGVILSCGIFFFLIGLRKKNL